MTKDARILVCVSEMARQLRMSTEQLRGLVRDGIVPACVLVARSGNTRYVLSPVDVARAIQPYLTVCVLRKGRTCKAAN